MRISLACVVLVLGASVVIVGCGKKETYSTPEGTVTVEQGGGNTSVTVEGEGGKLEMKGDQSKMTITTEQGTAVVESKPEVSEEEIGIAIYPGATIEQSLKQTDEESGDSMMQVHLSTPDAFDKVRSFYKGKLPAGKVAGDIETPDIKMYQVASGEESDQRMVMVSRDKSDTVTRIVLHRTQKEEE